MDGNCGESIDFGGTFLREERGGGGGWGNGVLNRFLVALPVVR